MLESTGLIEIFRAARDRIEVAGDQSRLRGETCIICTAHRIILGDRIIKDGMGGAY